MSPSRSVAFAVPGDIQTRTGGYLYDRALMEALTQSGWEVRHVELPGSFPDAPESDQAMSRDLFAGLPKGMPVLGDGLAGGALAPMALDAMRGPYVALVHHPLARETGLDAAAIARLEMSERRNLAQAAQVIVPSPHTRDVLVTDYGVPADKVTVAEPGVRRPAHPASPPKVPHILAVGIMIHRKGHDVLLKALGEISDLSWTATIAGRPQDPEVVAGLERLREELGLGARVQFVGEVGQSALEALYQGSTLFALATRYEGYGMVFAEALAAGLPIVSCRAGAVPDTVPEDAAILVAPDDIAGFSDALRSVLAEPGTHARMATAAETHGASLPSWSDTAKVVETVLEKAQRSAESSEFTR